MSQQDVIGVFRQDFTQIFADALMMKAVVKEEAKLMEHPVEDGSVITDHRIIQPTEIELSVITRQGKAKDAYNQIKDLFLQSESVIVQTRSGVYNNMILQGMPHDETSEVMNSIAMAVKLKEVKIVKARFGPLPAKKVANKNKSSTVDRGEQTGQPSSENKKSSTLASIFG